MRKIMVLIFVCSSLFILSAFAEEEITITTYYPSPFGSYRELRSQRVAIGDNYLNVANFTWEETDGDGGEVDALTDLVVEGNVGIGTATPNNLLQVRDYINFGATSPGGDPVLANTLLGYKAGFANTTGSANVAVGYDALRFNTSGTSNTAVGSGALVGNATGSGNTGLGFQALFRNTASNNTAVGAQALDHNTTGTDNTSIGYNTLTVNDTGNYNLAVGSGALRNNSSGSRNVAVGSALTNNTTGYENVGVGTVMTSNTTGKSNVAMGYVALNSNVSGEANVAIGVSALNQNTGSLNTALGHRAGRGLVNGFNNTFIGVDSGNANQSSNVNETTAIGNGAYTTQNYQIAIGNKDNILTNHENKIYLYGTTYIDILFQEQSFSDGYSAYIDYDCPAGYVILNGGIDCNIGSGTLPSQVNESRPVSPTRWRGRCRNNGVYANPSIYFHLNCIKMQDIP